jgi:hypothetical protein
MLTESEIATASPADLYEFRMAELNRAVYQGEVMPLPPFRKVARVVSGCSVENPSTMSLLHESLCGAIKNLAHCGRGNTDAHWNFVEGMIGATVIVMGGAAYDPAFDGWNTKQRTHYIHALMFAADAALRFAESNGGAK